MTENRVFVFSSEYKKFKFTGDGSQLKPGTG